MAELLTKEKQYIKLNEELNRMAIATATEHEAAVTKEQARFHTFQKSKGPSTLLRRQGAGDGFAEMADETTIKDVRSNTTTTNTVVGGDTYRLSNVRNFEPPTSFSPVQSAHASNTPQYRSKHSKCNESTMRSQTYNRVSNSRDVVPSNNSTFTIKYRNPKFLESPSLEVLVKEESSSLRYQTETSCIGSNNSLSVGDGIATERRSQTNSHAVVSKKNISSEGLIKFLKSKIVILEEDHERICQEMTKQKELLDKALEHTKTLEQQRDQANTKNHSLTDQLAKSEKQLEDANKRLKERSIEQNSLQKELETAKRELKLTTQTNSNLEKRLFKANEDLQSSRNALSLMKTSEREQKEASKKESETKEIQIKSLKKQRANLLNAYKKQLFLIDNLKRQNILLEQAKMLDFGEKEFAKVLDWKM